MIVGIGSDLVLIPRIEQSIRKFGIRFLERIYTETERSYADGAANRLERLAARFAAKEAGIKALGVGWTDDMTWRDFEVESRPGMPPAMRFHGAALRQANRLRIERTWLTLTHTVDHALAFVVLEA